MNKMLMIVPEYPFPGKCGMTVRIGDICRNIYDIVELHLFVCGNKKEVKSLDGQELFKSVTFAPESNTGYFLNETCIRSYRRVFKPLFDNKIYLSDNVLEILSNMQRQHSYDIVMVHTPLLSRTLEAFPDNIYRILDPHDIWYQRYLEFIKIGKGPLLFHFRDLEKEMNLYKSVNLVLAISLWDRDFMISHGIKPIYVPVSFKPQHLPDKIPPRADILYASGNGYANIEAIHFFIREIFPAVKAKITEARFMVPNACEELRKEYSSRGDIRMLPFFNDIQEAYLLADLVVIPLKTGTGLKIKVLESMSFGKPTILSSSAAQGIDLSGFAQINISNEPGILADETIRALTDSDYRNNLANSGLSVIRTHYNPKEVYAELRKMILQ